MGKVGQSTGLGALAVISSLVLLAACADVRDGENTNKWFDEATPYDVMEPVAFTDVPYDFPAAGAPGIADLVVPPDFETLFGPDDMPPAGCSDWGTDDSLPMEIEGVVTAHPRVYIKLDGCVPSGSDVDSDEKYYGSYFIQDNTGGRFVLGDSKVAHFDMGDHIRLRVRGMRTNFGQVMIAAHDVTDIERGPMPIYYEQTDQEFTEADDGKVMRVVGTVNREMDTFGAFGITGDNLQEWEVGLDSELNRRGVSYPIGARIQVTAPVQNSFGLHLVVMRVGQVEMLDAG